MTSTVKFYISKASNNQADYPVTWAAGHYHKMEAKCDIKLKVIWVKTRSRHSVPGASTCQGAAGLRRNAAKVTAIPLESFIA